MTTFAEAGETHPEAFVTVKVYVPATSCDIVEVTPDPVVTTAPGDLVKVHVPVAGRPLRTTLPVATEQVGWVIVPTVGADGAAAGALMTTFVNANEDDKD